MGNDSDNALTLTIEAILAACEERGISPTAFWRVTGGEPRPLSAAEVDRVLGKLERSP